MNTRRPSLPKLSVKRKPYPAPPKRGDYMKGIKAYQRRLNRMLRGR